MEKPTEAGKVRYLAKFRKGNGAMGLSAIDFYEESCVIVRHEWSMGGESREVVDSVPVAIKGYTRQGR